MVFLKSLEKIDCSSKQCIGKNRTKQKKKLHKEKWERREESIQLWWSFNMSIWEASCSVWLVWVFSPMKPLHFQQLVLPRFSVLPPPLLFFTIDLRMFFNRTFWLLISEKWLSHSFSIHGALASFESLDCSKSFKSCLSHAQDDSNKQESHYCRLSLHFILFWVSQVIMVKLCLHEVGSPSTSV